jgi:hypothetical protein
VKRATWLTALLLFACSGQDAGRAATASDRPLAAWSPPRLLSETGLYADAAEQRVRPDVLEFTPAYELWSDGAEKRRWLFLPPGQSIDASDPEHFRFPVGTRVWKEFRRDGKRLETRLIARIGPGSHDYWMGAFVWDAAERDALYREDGASDVLGTEHDVPSASRCAACHGGEPGRILGFSAAQLEAAPATPSLETLSAAGRLAPALSPVGAGVTFPSSTTRAALGYLHANCGHCHSETGLAYRDVDLVLRMRATEQDPERSDIYRTTLAVPLQRPEAGASAWRVVPGDPDQSGLVLRMRSRDTAVQMPPLATEHADGRGVSLISAWIRELSAGAR